MEGVNSSLISRYPPLNSFLLKIDPGIVHTVKNEV